MADNDKGLDVAGAGKLANAIPKEGWQKLIDTACNTFSELIAPITKTTAGLGGLIQAKFDSMIDAQKVFAADAVNRAKAKVERAERIPNAMPKAKVLIPAIESASLETDDDLRDIWSNLIANEILDGSVHPEFPRVLSRLSSGDAVVLAEIAEKNEKSRVQDAAKALAGAVAFWIIDARILLEEPADFSREHLERLGLVSKPGPTWRLTHFGEEFVKAVTDPNYSNTTNHEP